MRKGIRQVLDNRNDDNNQFKPFRDRKTFWGDQSMRPLIPNVSTVIPPDVPPELRRILLYRMKLEELAYKLNNLETQSINAIYLENQLDRDLYPDMDDVIQSRAKKCLGIEMRLMIREIDNALPPPILLPKIIIPSGTDVESVQSLPTPSYLEKRADDISFNTFIPKFQRQPQETMEDDTFRMSPFPPPRPDNFLNDRPLPNSYNSLDNDPPYPPPPSFYSSERQRLFPPGPLGPPPPPPPPISRQFSYNDYDYPGEDYRFDSDRYEQRKSIPPPSDMFPFRPDRNFPDPPPNQEPPYISFENPPMVEPIPPRKYSVLNSTPNLPHAPWTQGQIRKDIYFNDDNDMD